MKYTPSKTTTSKLFRPLANNVNIKIDIDSCFRSVFTLQATTSFSCQSHFSITCHADPGLDAADECNINEVFFFVFCSSITLRWKLALKACHGRMKRQA